MIARSLLPAGLLTVCLFGVAAGSLQAEEPSTAPAARTPSLQVRFRSLTELLDKAEYVAGLFDQAEAVRGVKALLFLSRLQGKGVEGIHPDRPFGLYAFFSPDLISSSFVVLVPIADRETFLTLLKQRLGCTVDKRADASYRLGVPAELPFGAVGIDGLFLRFEQDYACISRLAEDTEPKRLIAPRTFFAADDGAVLSLQLRLDHISDDAKKFLLGQFEMGLEDGMRKDPPQDEVGKLLAPWLKKHVMNLTQTTFMDAETFQVNLYLEPRKEELRGEVRLTAKSGSLLASNLRSFAERKSLAAGIIQTVGEAAVRAEIHGALTPQARADFARVAKEVADTAVKQAGPDEREFVEGLFAALLPTLRNGQFDVAAALLPADRQGRHRFLAAVEVREGKGIEKYLKTIAPILNVVDLADFSFDRESLGEFRLHRAVINGLPETVERLFGTTTVWLAISDRCLVLSIEESGDLLRTAVKKGQAMTTPLLHVDASAAQLLPALAPHLRPDEIKALYSEAFGEKGPHNRDRIRLTLTAGNQLSLQFQLHGGAIRLFNAAKIFDPGR